MYGLLQVFESEAVHSPVHVGRRQHLVIHAELPGRFNLLLNHPAILPDPRLELLYSLVRRPFIAVTGPLLDPLQLTEELRVATVTSAEEQRRRQEQDRRRRDRRRPGDTAERRGSPS